MQLSISSCDKLAAARVIVRGTVQGVGFRPFVFALAKRLSLRGSVRNAGGTVEIFLCGTDEVVERFIAALRSDCPPLAVIDEIISEYLEIPADLPADFAILESSDAGDAQLKVPPDVATCAECLAEVFDPADRRYLYPFTNCTNCGPRFTVIDSLPYDRHGTTMSCFPMCAECSDEYRDPTNRRFHAQPNACWICGPQLFFLDVSSAPIKRLANNDLHQLRENAIETIDKVVEGLRRGDIVAIKGLGGFHLACDASNQEAVIRLRQRKRRNKKPFAVMFRDFAQISEYCDIDAEEKNLLTGHRRPVVLLKQREASDHGLASDVSNELGTIGAMLPYTPLQALLLDRFKMPLVMTSGNLRDEPIALGNREAISRLKDIADRFLLNDRDIGCRFDDSVVRVIDSAPAFIRRARGYSPESITVPVQAERVVLALGAQLKTTFAFVRDNQAYVGQHVGDTNNLETLTFLEQAIDHNKQLFRLKPEMLACDMHPDYQTSRLAEAWSKSQALPLIQVQHHHAHIVSCMAEHGLKGPVIGVAFDGTGYGDDGTVWGGEFLVCDLTGYRRVGRLSTVPLPGGEAAIRNPWRMAVSYLHAACGRGFSSAERVLRAFADRIGRQQVAMVISQIDRGLNSPSTSSCGRLFDAMASLAEVCDRADFEGEAAMLLEACAAGALSSSNFEAAKKFAVTQNGLLEIDSVELFAEMVRQLFVRRMSVQDIAYRFHGTLAQASVRLCGQLSDAHGIKTVCLSGGVFQNKILTEMMVKGLGEIGLVPLLQRKVPPNDGGIALGQAIVAAARDKEGRTGKCV